MIKKLNTLWLYATTDSGRTRAELESENAALREQLAKRVIDETFITGIAMTGGSLNAGLEGGAARLMAEMLAEQVEESGAVNYLEARFASKHIKPGEQYVVTVQKCSGKTPHELRLVADADRDATLRQAADALLSVRQCLTEANEQPGGPINDTIWFSAAETLFDYIDSTVESMTGTKHVFEHKQLELVPSAA